MSFGSLEQWKDLKLEEIYHPIFQQNMRIIFLLIFLTESLIFPFSIFIIKTQSTKEMGNYKYLLIYHLICSYFFRMFMFIFKPVFLFPLPLVYANSFFEIGQKYLFQIFAYAFVPLIMAMHALLASFAYRAGITFMDGKIYAYFSNYWLMGLTNFVGVTIVIVIFIAPILLGAVDVPKVQAAFVTDIPALETLFKLHPMSAGFHPSFATKWLKLFLYDGIGAVIILPICFFVIHITFKYRIKKLHKSLSASTYRLHLMLYRALTIQLLGTTIVFFIPLGLFVGVYFLQLKYGSIYANLILNVGGTEMITNALINLYFIKPYRIYCLKLFRKIVPLKSNAIASRRSGVLTPTEISISIRIIN